MKTDKKGELIGIKNAKQLNLNEIRRSFATIVRLRKKEEILEGDDLKSPMNAKSPKDQTNFTSSIKTLKDR